MVGSPPDAGDTDARHWVPYPVTCANAAPGWIPVGPSRHQTPQACPAPIALSMTAQASTSAVPHFFRCGAFGPEIETNVRFSPDGSLVATLTSAGTVRLFSTFNWREVAQLAPLSGRIDAFAFSPDGAHLATLAMEPGELTVWNTNGALDRTFTGEGTQGRGPVAKAAVAFSRDGLRIASSLGTIVSLDGRAAVSLGGVSRFVDQLAFTMCDTKLYARRYYPIGDSSWTTEVSLIDAQTGQTQYLFDKGDDGFSGSALSADGRLIAISRADQPNQPSELSIYRGDTGELVDERLDCPPGTIQAFTPDDTALLVASNGQLTQWRIADGSAVASYPFDAASQVLGFSRSDRITIGSLTGTTTWSLSGQGQQIASLGFAATAASWTADGASGVAVAPDGTLFHVWHEPDATEVCAPAAPGSPAAVTGFGLSGDGQVLGLGMMDGAVDLVDTATGATRGRIATPAGPIFSVSLSWDGTTVAAQGSSSDPVQLWSLDGGLTSLRLPANAAFVSVSPDGRTIAAGDGRASTVLIDVATGAARATTADGAWTAGALFSPDSLEVAGRSGGLATWRASDGERDDLLVVPGAGLPVDMSGGLFSVALSSDWSRAAAVNFDRMIVWDPRTGAEISEVAGLGTNLPSTVAAVAGATAAANDYLGNDNGAASWVLRLYDAPTGIELRAFDAAPGARLLLLGSDGTRAYTLEGPDVIAWCR